MFPRVDFGGLFSALWGRSIIIIFYSPFHFSEMSTKSLLNTGLLIYITKSIVQGGHRRR